MDNSKQAKRLTFSILVMIFGFAFVMNSTGILMNGVINDFSLIGYEQGLMSSMIAIGSLVALVVMPLLQGRIKKWVMLIASGVIQIVVMVSLGIFNIYGLLLICYILLGVGNGWLDSYANSIVMDINSGNSTKPMGVLHGWFGVGGLIAPIAIQSLLAYTNWRGIYFMLAGLVALTVLQFVFQSKRTGTSFNVSSIEEPKLRFHEVTNFLKKKYNLFLIGGAMMFSATFSSLAVWIVRYMFVRFDAPELGATALSVFWVFGTLSRFLAPHIKLRPLKLFIIGALSIVVFLTIGILSGNQIVIIIMYGVIGLLSGHCMPMIMQESLKKYPGRTSLPTSVMLLVMCITRIFMPLLVGFIAAISTISVAMMLPVGTGLLTAMFALFALRTDIKDLEANKKATA